MTLQNGEISVDITEAELQFGVSAGIELRLPQTGMISVYEENDAREQAHISLTEWGNMDYMEKALTVAMYRVRNAVRNHQAEAEIRESRRRTRSTGE